MVGSPMPMTSEAIITRKNARNREVAAISVTSIDMRTPSAASTSRPTMRPMADVAATRPEGVFRPCLQALEGGAAQIARARLRLGRFALPEHGQRDQVYHQQEQRGGQQKPDEGNLAYPRRVRRVSSSAPGPAPREIRWEAPALRGTTANRIPSKTSAGLWSGTSPRIGKRLCSCVMAAGALTGPKAKNIAARISAPARQTPRFPQLRPDEPERAHEVDHHEERDHGLVSRPGPASRRSRCSPAG